MVREIYLNLPVSDLPRSIAFFTALGFSFNAQYTDETATCMIVGEHIYVMLLTREKFESFSPHPVSDAHQRTEVLTCLSLDTRARVDELVAKALAAGGKTYSEPKDYGFMYGHGFQDPDGHVWELTYMETPVGS